MSEPESPALKKPLALTPGPKPSPKALNRAVVKGKGVQSVGALASVVASERGVTCTKNEEGGDVEFVAGTRRKLEAQEISSDEKDSRPKKRQKGDGKKGAGKGVGKRERDDTEVEKKEKQKKKKEDKKRAKSGANSGDDDEKGGSSSRGAEVKKRAVDKSKAFEKGTPSVTAVDVEGGKGKASASSTTALRIQPKRGAKETSKKPADFDSELDKDEDEEDEEDGDESEFEGQQGLSLKAGCLPPFY